jgi:hydrogenase nickel incorporation protein HypA/HybF
MHEFSVMSYLLEAVQERAQELEARKVLAINLVVGDRAGIVDDSLGFYFDMLTPGTLVEGALLNVRRTPMRFHCSRCDDDYSPVGADFDCPTCRTVGRVTDDGSTLLIESIEIET